MGGCPPLEVDGFALLGNERGSVERVALRGSKFFSKKKWASCPWRKHSDVTSCPLIRHSSRTTLAT